MPKFLTVFIMFILAAPVHGLDLPSSQIADDSLLRIKLKDAWFTESPARVLAQRAVIQYLESGERVEVRAEEQREEFMVILSRELYSGRAENTGRDNGRSFTRTGTGQFPGWAQGSWILTRRKDTGESISIRIFPRSDQYAYIQFRPFSAVKKVDDKCLMDVVVYGGYLVNSMPIGVGFERLYTMQLNDILKLAGNRFPRRYFDPDPENYREHRKLIAQVREQIKELNYADDGAIDEHGEYVYIKTLNRQNPEVKGLNCSGFTKWLVDGLLRPVTGERLPIPPLREPFGQRGSSFTENWEERRDVFFGLDWIRNLAAEANGTLRSEAYRVLDEFEVRSEIISSVMVRTNRGFASHSYPGFFKEAGFGIEGLRPLLYALAIDEPYQFYLAAVNTEISTPANENPFGTPRLRQYFHVAALIPYFDEFGSFRIAVFESADETSFNSFRARYPGHHVNLVSIPVSAKFEP
ncbi:MAG: hypothetical protein LBH16_09565 [Treponema sp.]|jgi:hypothetical protein|nr:hypothetical protein [Treponema sp.]